MPFPYMYICDLLQQLDDEVRKSPVKQTPPDTIIKSWFQQHRSLINAPDNDPCIILSTLLPERRTDRVYNIQAPKLQSIFGKALLLGASRVLELRRWADPGSGIDLADCIESALRRTPNSRDDTTKLMVEEIDETLGRIAAACRFSSPTVRAQYQASTPHDANTLLAKIYTRLGSRDAKWFTRLVLKNYQPVALNANVVFRCYHPLLPQMMKIRDDLSISTAFVRHIDATSNQPSAIASILKPRLGTKVGRQPWFKGRSIKNCMNMLRGREFVCEQKLDGEYCQIHIDLRKPHNSIQIFSKSGKDSTADRIGLHRAIRDSLKLGSEDCPLKQGCILEGELVVYSTKENKILPFHKIRKHVTRSGSFLGTANDSQAHEHEHLMIVYFDILLIDDESLLGVKNSDRFRRLSNLITCRKGYAELVPRTNISASQSSAAPALRELFAQCIASRGEGLVLKPDEPYFDFNTRSTSYGCCNIKLKKEYVQGWGDVGDFAVVGASYDAAKAREYKLPGVKWTHFFIGCLENKSQAMAKTEMPRFRVTNMVELTGPVLSTFWAQQRPLWVPYEDNTSLQLDYSGSFMAKRPTVVFPLPLVFDMRCFSFDKEPNTNFWSMRFPQVSKVHQDRSYLDTISFSELQKIAEGGTNAPDEEESQEMRKWVEALEKMDHRRLPANTSSQETSCSDGSPLPSTSCFRLQDRHTEHELHTRPRSSAETELTRPTTVISNHAKRPVTELSDSSHTAKRRRTEADMSSKGSTQQSISRSSSFPRMKSREPLSQKDPNVSEKRGKSQHQTFLLPLSTLPAQEDFHLPLDKQAAPSSPVTYLTASEMISSPDRTTRTPRNSMTAERQNNSQETKSPCCSIVETECALVNCSILLAPCISSYAWVTDDLLKRHGITDPLLDPRVWKSVRSDCGSAPGTPQATPGGTGRRVRKICLVESRRKEATEAFLEKVKAASLKKRSGEREWVSVYDWRVLEFITEQEEKRKEKPEGASRATDPWRRFYVGIA